MSFNATESNKIKKWATCEFLAGMMKLELEFGLPSFWLKLLQFHCKRHISSNLQLSLEESLEKKQGSRVNESDQDDY